MKNSLSGKLNSLETAADNLQVPHSASSGGLPPLGFDGPIICNHFQQNRPMTKYPKVQVQLIYHINFVLVRHSPEF
jgi:hypothetical protein